MEFLVENRQILHTIDISTYLPTYPPTYLVLSTQFVNAPKESM